MCKEHHLKITPQRVAVYEAVKDSRMHPSADSIHKTVKQKFPNISLDTVNRTLLTLVDAGVIEVVEGEGDARRFDPNLDLHHHFYCLGCNRIFDFFDEKLNQIDVSGTIHSGFKIVSQRVHLRGYCDRCSQKRNGIDL